MKTTTKKKIAIVGAGQAGLQLGMSLLGQDDCEVTLYSDRNPEKIAAGSLMATAILFEGKLVIQKTGVEEIEKLAAANDLVVVAAGKGPMAKIMSRHIRAKDDANFSEAWNKRATLHYLAGDLDASVDDIKQTIQLEPRHFGAISGLGLIFLKRGQLQNALDAFEQVLKISPQSINTQRSVEQVRDKLGNKI